MASAGFTHADVAGIGLLANGPGAWEKSGRDPTSPSFPPILRLGLNPLPKACPPIEVAILVGPKRFRWPGRHGDTAIGRLGKLLFDVSNHRLAHDGHEL